MTYLAVITNTKKLAPADRKRLRAAIEDAPFAKVEWFPIQKGSAAKDAAAKALADGADIVLACGGDGTVRAAAEALVGTDSALAVMPSGTANQFASAMSMPTDVKELLPLLASGQTRTIDTGRCNGMTFLVMAGIGFDAAMIDAADDDKERLGMVAYLRAGAKEARRAAAVPRQDRDRRPEGLRRTRVVRAGRQHRDVQGVRGVPRRRCRRMASSTLPS